jgi:tetratricopeptide (TPR) repeat protein/predicted Ser/Thr protein kinase
MLTKTSDEAGEIQRPTVDSLELDRQKRDLLGIMFSERSDSPRFGHYVILHKLGAGGMGVVYAAYDPRLERKVAIKKLHGGRGDKRLMQRLVREAQAMAKLVHPNVVTVHEIGEVEGTTFIVMEYVEGVTLRQWLAQAPRSRIEISTVFKAAAHGLLAAHEKGLVHRDFKPENVMLGNDGRVRVMDFGLARTELHEDDSRSTQDDAGASSSQLTKSGVLLGTIPYMAPEQLRAEPADAASDQFAYCVSLYQALYGVRPYGGQTPAQRLSVIEQGEIHEPAKNSAVPGWLREIVVRGLEPRPEDRFESMRALLDALEARELAADVDGREPPEYMFVAYDSVDQQMVRRLCEGLLDHGIRPWLDIWDVRPDLDWRTQMQGALHKAPAVLLCHGPGGWNERDPGFAAVLRARIEADPMSVYRVGLPGAVAGPLPVSESCEGIDLHEDDWEAAVAELVRIVGADRERRDWLGYEAKRAGMARAELCPYRGLEAFKEVDARWMFGRDEEIGELVEVVRAGEARFLTIIGASGSGKSSLVMAGLCPALRNGVLDDGRVWKIGYLRPGPRPCEALAHALVNLGARDGPMEVKALRDELLADPDTLRSVVSRTSEAKILLVIDQLEELFTEADLGRGNESSEGMAFVRNIVQATGRSETLWVVSTLRADFVQRCLEIGALARALKSGTYVALPPMGEQQIRAAVELPAKRVGYDVDARLVERLVVGVADQPGRLPLLQHVLRELWQRRDDRERVLPYDVYEETGGLEGAIAAAAERGLDKLRRELGDQADVVTRRVMTRLVHLGKGTSGDTRRRASLDQHEVNAATRRVLEVFVAEARVLVASEEDGVEVFELAHEALLREWTTLVDWLEADRAALRVRQELAKDAGDQRGRSASEYLWGKGRLEEAKRILRGSTVELGHVERTFLDDSDRHARQRAWLARGSVVAFMTVALAVVVFVLRKNTELEFQRDRAEEQTRLAQDRLGEAVNLAQAIIDEVLPKLERHPQVRVERKEILERLQAMLKELGFTDADTEASRQKMLADKERGDEALHSDNLEVARREYTEMLASATKLFEANPLNTRAQRDLSVSLSKFGWLEFQAGNLVAARGYLQRCLDIRTAIADADPLSSQAQRDLSIAHYKLGLLENEAGDLAAARDQFQRCLAIRETLADSDPLGARTQRDLALVQEQLGDLERTAGNLSAAREHFQRFFTIASKLAQADPVSAEAQQDLYRSHEWLSKLEVEAGNLSVARDHLQHVVRLAEALADADPTSAQTRRNLFVSHVELGTLEMTSGNLSAARDHYQQGLEITSALAQADPLSVLAQRDLSLSHCKLADLELAAGNLSAAREHYYRRFAIAQKLADAHPLNAKVQRDLSLADIELGSLEIIAGNLSAAREHFDHALETAEMLADADQLSAQAQRDLSLSIERLGDLEVKAGNLSAAREHFKRSFAIVEALAEADPLSPLAQRNLSVAHNKLGELDLEVGDATAAVDHFQRAAAIGERLAKASPLSAQAQRDLSYSHHFLSTFESQLGNLTAAREHLHKALAIREKLAEADPLNAQARSELAVSLDELGDLEARSGNLSAADDYLQRALTVADALAKANPTNADAQFDVVRYLEHLAALAQTQGNAALAIEHFKRARAILDEMEAKGQITEYAEREQVRDEIESVLGGTSLRP